MVSSSERRDGASAGTAPNRQASSGTPTVSRWVLPQPHGNRLFSVWLAPWGDVIAVGDGGTVQHSVDYGEHWNVRQLGDMVLRGIWGPGDDRVYLVGDRGRLYLSRDRARSFEPVTTGSESDFFSITGRGDELYVAGSGGVVLHSVDAGRSWTTRRLQPVRDDARGSSDVDGVNDLIGIALASTGRVATVAGGGAIYYSDDSGASWKQIRVTTQDLGQPSGADQWHGQELVKIVAHGTEFLILTHHGFPRESNLPTDSWSPTLSLERATLGRGPLSERLDRAIDDGQEFAPTSYEDLLLDASGTAVVIGGVHGRSWAKLTEGSLQPAEQEPSEAADRRAPQEAARAGSLLFALDSGSVVRSMDGGRHWRTWQQASAATSAVWAEGNRAILFGRGVAQTSSDGGRSWSPPHKHALLPDTDYGQRASGSEGHVYLSDNGTSQLLGSTDFGSNWSQVRLPAHKGLSIGDVWSREGAGLVVVADVYDGRRYSRCKGGAILVAKGGKWSTMASAKAPWPQGTPLCLSCSSRQ